MPSKKKLVITIEDQPGGGVLITSTPSLADLVERAKTPRTLTSAEGYAMQAWIAIHMAGYRIDHEPIGLYSGGLH